MSCESPLTGLKVWLWSRLLYFCTFFVTLHIYGQKDAAIKENISWYLTLKRTIAASNLNVTQRILIIYSLISTLKNQNIFM